MILIRWLLFATFMTWVTVTSLAMIYLGVRVLSVIVNKIFRL